MASANIGCHAAIERVYSSETFADGSARNSLTTAESKRGVVILSALGASGDFALERAAGARTAPINHEDFVMGSSIFRPALIALVGTAALSGCYYDPATGLTYAYPPPPAYGFPQPTPPGAYGGPAPEYGAPPAGGYGLPPSAAYGAPPPAARYETPPAGGYGGTLAPGYGQPPIAGGDITRAQFVARAQQRAETHNRDPQRAAARAGIIFDQIDVNHTGIISRDQLRAWREAHRPPQGAGAPPPGQY
jgi:hypothetical protein